MTPALTFANYPSPEEAQAKKYAPNKEKNPVLRGIPLVIGSNLISSFSSIGHYFWSNAHFGDIKNMPELDEMPPRFDPCVIPLGETGPMLEFEPHLLKSKYTSSGTRYYTASDYHEMYKAGSLTPLQVAEALLPVIRRGQKPPGKYEDAWVDTHGKDHLAIAAATASTERYAAGKPLSVLDGVPIGVKDDTNVKGYVNHFGMAYRPDLPFFREQDESSWPVKKLVEAGAVIIGKNAMHEIGSETSGLNVSQGTPTNHMNNAYYPGGSSSGGSSALSAGVVPIVMGTDAGGSTRIPAVFNGVYGLKTSHHRTMIMPAMTMCVTSPIAANVADLTIAYRVTTQPNPECSTQGLFALSRPPASDAPRVMGVVRDWFNDADPEVAGVCQKALDYFARERGYEIVDIDIPHLPEGRLAHNGICITEMAEKARRRTPNPADWLSLCASANRLLLSVAKQTPAADYLKYNSLRELLMRHVAFLFQKHPGLLIMTPTLPFAGWPRISGDEAYGLSDTNISVRSTLYIFLANMTGAPAASAPVGYVPPAQGKGDLPVGLMAMGEWGAEEQLLAWAGEAEEYLHNTYEGGRRRPEAWLDVMEAARAAKED